MSASIAEMKAVAHPLRYQMLEVLGAGVSGQSRTPWSPAGIARHLDERVNLVAWHMHELRDAGMVELVKTVPKRGSTEHFYRVTVVLALEQKGDPVLKYRAGKLYEVQEIDVTVKRRR